VRSSAAVKTVHAAALESGSAMRTCVESSRPRASQAPEPVADALTEEAVLEQELEASLAADADGGLDDDLDAELEAELNN